MVSETGRSSSRVMAYTGATTSLSQPSLPIFKGEHYELWSVKMKTLFKSQDLWDLIENGYKDPDEETRLRENRKRDSKALFSFSKQYMRVSSPE